MPEVRKADQFGRRHAIRIVAVTLVGFVGGGIALFKLPTIDHWTIGGGAVFVIVMAILLALSMSPGSLICPNCGSRIATPISLVGPLQYHCVKCDIIWDTGVRQWVSGD
jgi:hypothetical protein